MRIDMPKKAKKKSKGVVYSHEEIKKEAAELESNLRIRIAEIERIERNRKPDFRRRWANLMAIN